MGWFFVCFFLCWFYNFWLCKVKVYKVELVVGFRGLVVSFLNLEI